MWDVFDGPFLNTETYGAAQLAWYFAGWLLWVPVYWVVIARLRNGYLEIPAVAACGNITWEFLWGYVYPQDMGWGLQFIYMGAFVMDLAILYGVVRFGRLQVDNLDARRFWPLVVPTMLTVWTVYYVGFIEQGYDLPLGSMTAYTVNLVMSVAYLWFGLTKPLRHLSMVAAVFKFLGTGGVTVFVFMTYPDQPLVLALAAMVTVLDVSYILLLIGRRAAEQSDGDHAAPTPAVVVENREPATT